MEPQITNGTAVYRIGKFDLILPHDHKLPEYQRVHRLYDRFPLVLASHVEEGTIVDIGANVGDTAAAFASAAENPIMCIEPEASFFNYLTRNAALINKFRDQIKCYPFAIGQEGRRGKIDTSSSTGTFVVENEGNCETIPLDVLLHDHGPESGSICLIKSDTDGLDGFVIASGRETIQQYEPLLFFECDFKNDEQFAAMLVANALLEESGYDMVSVFDNYGNLIAPETNFQHASEILDYSKNRGARGSSNEFYYIDILASTKRRRENHRAAIRDYEQFVLGDAEASTPQQ